MTTNVSARTIRAAFAAGEFTAPDEALLSLTGHGPNGEGTGKVRGRLHPAAIEAYIAANPNNSYVPKAVTDEPTVMVPRTKVDAKGRKRSLKPVEMTVSEVKAAAGVPGQRGRVSKAMIEAASASLV